MVPSSLGSRYESILERIRAAALSAGRDPAAVRLLAISKLHSIELIQDAFALGQRAFGENYVQEAAVKTETYRAPGLEWHFVGRIQTNKVKQLVDRFAYIHSVERFEVAERLSAASTSRQKIFVQFNVADESSKGGADVLQVKALVARIDSECPMLTVVGLMVMPPMFDDPERTRPYFKLARELLVELKQSHPDQPLCELSMGTSGDFAVAIQEGATWIRVGTEIFGPRPVKT